MCRVYLGVVFGSTAISLKEWQLTHADGIPLSQYYDGRGSESKRHRISLIGMYCDFFFWYRLQLSSYLYHFF